jgi:hypothetical protein
VVRGDRHIHHARLPLQSRRRADDQFHLPRSTLFMLVSAFSGLETMRPPIARIETGYRFYSYGDACLLFRKRRAMTTPFSFNC